MKNNLALSTNGDSIKLLMKLKSAADIKLFEEFKYKTTFEFLNNGEHNYLMLEWDHEEFSKLLGSKDLDTLQQYLHTAAQQQNNTIYASKWTYNYLNSNQQFRKTLNNVLQIQNLKIDYQDDSRLKLNALQVYIDNKHLYCYNKIVLPSEDLLIQAASHTTVILKENMPQQFLMVQLQGNMRVYVVDLQKRTIQQVISSIIGQITFCSIIHHLFPIPHKPLNQLVDCCFKQGTIDSVDLMIKDVYGQFCSQIGMNQKMICASLGKFAIQKQQNIGQSDKKNILKSLLVSYYININMLIGLTLSKYKLSQAVIIQNAFECKYLECLMQICMGLYDPKKKFYFLNQSKFFSCLQCLDY